MEQEKECLVENIVLLYMSMTRTAQTDATECLLNIIKLCFVVIVLLLEHFLAIALRVLRII